MWKTLFYLLTLFCESKIILLKKSITKKKIYKSEFASKQWEKLGGGHECRQDWAWTDNVKTRWYIHGGTIFLLNLLERSLVPSKESFTVIWVAPTYNQVCLVREKVITCVDFPGWGSRLIWRTLEDFKWLMRPKWPLQRYGLRLCAQNAPSEFSGPNF